MVNGFNFAGQSNYYTTSTSRETAVVEERQEHNIQHINRSLPPDYFYMYYIIKLLWGSGFGVVGCSISFLIDFAAEIAFCSFHRNCHSLHQFLRGGRRLHAHFIPNCLPTSPIYTLFFRQMDMGIDGFAPPPPPLPPLALPRVQRQFNICPKYQLPLQVEYRSGTSISSI